METHLGRRIETLNDLELTILTCLVAGEHCILSAPQGYEGQLRDEAFAACSSTFGCEPCTLSCNANTSIDDFNNGLVTRPGAEQSQAIAKTMLLYDLDLATEDTQVQVIELLRMKRIYTRSAMYVAPKNFLLIIVLSKPEALLSYHLNDMLAASYLYQYQNEVIPNDGAPLLSMEEIDTLRSQAARVRLTAEVDAYLYDIVLFMRMSRYVQAGVSATATRHMRILCKALAALHDIDYVTPSIVMLAARHVYPHRLTKASTFTEKSVQWGSDPEAVERLLNSMTTTQVIDDVIASVETPL